MQKVFIDGSAGTTGLRIVERLSARDDISLIELPEARRKDFSARLDAVSRADVSILCLPDEAARELCAAAPEDAVIIDTSTAHRTSPGWVYGFPELTGRDAVKNAKRIANPGCHATGFISLAAPLVRAGIIDKSALLTCFSVTGYSGGGKKMIAEYEGEGRGAALDSPRQYGLTQAHKHLPEMQKLCGLDTAPIFSPIVADYFSGMAVTVPVFSSQLNGTAEDIAEVYKNTYPGPVVRFETHGGPMLPANALTGRDDMIISVLGNGERILLTALFDNLGKGASGAAVQNMNIVLGIDETEGLVLQGRTE